MMQQLAAKQSDIAALDIGKRETIGTSRENTSQTSFTDVIREVSSQTPSTEKSQSKPAASPVTDNKAVRSGETASSASDTASENKVSRVEVKRGEEHASLPNKDPLEKKQPLPGDGDAVAQWIEEQEGDVDWLAYVDAVQSADQKLSEQDRKALIDNELDSEDALLAKAMLALEEVAHPPADSDGLITLTDSAGKTFTTSIGPVIEQIVGKLNDAEGSDKHQQDLQALAGVLLTLQKEGEVSIDSDTVMTRLADALPAVDAKKGSEAEKVSELIASALSQANAENKNQSQDEGDEALLLSLIQNELSAADKKKSDSQLSAGKDNASIMSSAMNATSQMASDDNLSQLMQDMQTMSDASAEDMTDALSSKIVALMPNASSEQQQTVKNALISGINEIQQQLSKGHEPGIDLKTVIQQAMTEANIAQSQSVMTQIEQQAAQLHQVVSTAQQTMQQVLTSQMVSADAVIQENSQIRSESGKGQQSTDAIDNKPVNITKAEGQQQLQEKIRWMVNSRSTLAEIRLDPPELGSMQVRVNMNGDAASVNFVVQSQQARDALNDAMPRLRDMLSEQGIELGESFVQQESGDGSGEADGQAGSGNGQYASESDEDTEVREQPLTRQETGGIDYYV
ncbi:flagellar hook-length control protein FliK [Alteromonas halophila]|uniref:Flagellar hook-length control protein FliK n=1 Tax=Alteromonas halophila TaxID=516698 RepID=A0A918JFT4_9ALTE|nr:flagellar hook-length control protein FliK [Alteromonas halophila]GGW73647.1 flagellar hook-length control protein FliK [Alteromonas halophila]